jgi:hypothetical protein
LCKGESSDFQSRGFALLSCFRAEQERWTEAEELLRQGTEFDRANGLPRSALEQKQRLLAEVYLRQNRRDEAVRICRAALDRISGRQMQMQFGAVLAQAGDVSGAVGCLPAEVPDWPVYQVWVKRLEGEIALARGQAAKSLELMKLAKLPPSKRIWPDHVARAALAARDYAAAGECFGELLMHPGLYWLAAEQNTPGMIAYAVRTVVALAKWPELTERTKVLSPLLKGAQTRPH